VKSDECVHCGACCKKTPCGFGEWDKEKSCCAFLVPSENGEFVCGKYSEIIKDPTSEFSPAFGAGCCMNLFNTEREAVLRRRAKSGK
jgi:hypothetical protein